MTRGLIVRRRRSPNHRLVKINRTYTVGEIAKLFSTHKNTVRTWIKVGLPTCDRKRPILVLGRDLAEFLRDRRARRKQPCQPGEMYCVRCRAPRFPAGNMADYAPITEKLGNLEAICPDCDSIMNRRVSFAKLGPLQGKIDITFPQGLQLLSEINQPSVNGDLEKEAQTWRRTTQTTNESNANTSTT